MSNPMVLLLVPVIFAVAIGGIFGTFYVLGLIGKTDIGMRFIFAGAGIIFLSMLLQGCPNVLTEDCHGSSDLARCLPPNAGN